MYSLRLHSLRVHPLAVLGPEALFRHIRLREGRGKVGSGSRLQSINRCVTYKLEEERTTDKGNLEPSGTTEVMR